MRQSAEWHLRVMVRFSYRMSNDEFAALMGAPNEATPKDPARHRFWFGTVFKSTSLDDEPFDQVAQKVAELNQQAAPASVESRMVHVSIRHKRTSGGVKFPSSFLAAIAALGMELEVLVEDLHYLAE